MQIPLVAGRNFDAQDRAGSQKVAIVDEEFVKRYYGGNTRVAIGSFLGLGEGSKLNTQIVGVVPALRSVDLQNAPTLPFVYLPYDQIWSMRHSFPAAFYVRTGLRPDDLTGAIRKAVVSVDHTLPIVGLQTMREQVDSSIFEQRLIATLAVSMGGLALFLSAIGLYGVLAFAVTQKTRELGIRVALGASRRNLAVLVIRRLAVIVGVGIGVGAPLAWAGTRWLRQPTNVSGSSVWMFAAGAIILFAVSVLAGFLPLRRAMSVDPIRVLRAE